MRGALAAAAVSLVLLVACSHTDPAVAKFCDDVTAADNYGIAPVNSGMDAEAERLYLQMNRDFPYPDDNGYTPPSAEGLIAAWGSQNFGEWRVQAGTYLGAFCS